jgi:RNA polymerase sigma factor (sigma-70 family)
MDVAEVYRRHGHSVLRRATQILGNEQEAFDVLQDVFVSLLKKPDQFSGRSSIMTFLYASTTHLCLNRIRNQTNRRRLIEEKVRPITPECKSPCMEERTRVRSILAAVPEELAQVAIYYYFDELNQSEIAEILGCTRRNVGYLLERFGEFARREERVA